MLRQVCNNGILWDRPASCHSADADKQPWLNMTYPCDYGVPLGRVKVRGRAEAPVLLLP